jgi:hypothetical protein
VRSTGTLRRRNCRVASACWRGVMHHHLCRVYQPDFRVAVRCIPLKPCQSRRQHPLLDYGRRSPNVNVDAITVRYTAVNPRLRGHLPLASIWSDIDSLAAAPAAPDPTGTTAGRFERIARDKT